MRARHGVLLSTPQGRAYQRVYSASSSKESAQPFPQKRRTLSSGFSQYQQEPLAGKLRRVGMVRAADAANGSAITLSFGKLSCIVSKIHPQPQHVNP
ncbi:MAG: hypothetical protein AB1584_19950 [Pseudomonadota bacterium]